MKSLIKLFLITLPLLFTLFSCNDESEDLKKETTLNNSFVSEDLAKKVANNFMNIASKKQKTAFKSSNETIPISGFESKKIENIVIVPDENNEPALYIVTFKPNGYIIISATKKESPILAYSVESNFDINNISTGLESWFVGRINKIQILKYSEDIKIPTYIQNEWAKWDQEEYDKWEREQEEKERESYIKKTYLGKSSYSKGPLIQTKWAQSEGYNNYAQK